MEICNLFGAAQVVSDHLRDGASLWSQVATRRIVEVGRPVIGSRSSGEPPEGGRHLEEVVGRPWTWDGGGSGRDGQSLSADLDYRNNDLEVPVASVAVAFRRPGL